jgi:TonB family protein
MNVIVRIFLVIAACAGIATAQAPATKPHPGILLFDQAKYKEAVLSLEGATRSNEYKNDAEMWNYLGLAYRAKDDLKKSRKAFERSVSLQPQNAVYHANLGYALLAIGEVKKALQSAEKALALDSKNAGSYQIRGIINLWNFKLDPAEADADMSIKLRPVSVDAHLLKSEVILTKLSVQLAAGKAIREEVSYLERAVHALQFGIEQCSKCADVSRIREQLDTVSVFYDHYTKSKAPSSVPEDGVTPLRITNKPQARYTDRARTNNVSGVVRLAVLCGVNGRIEHILLLKRLGFGLDQRAIEAAKEIRFEPKMKDGKPVPTVITIEYSFTIF